MPVGLDPLGTRGRRIREGEREDRNRLPQPPTSAHGDDLVVIREINTLDRDLHAEEVRLERHREVILQHRVEPHPLFFIAIGIDERFCDEPVELHR